MKLFVSGSTGFIGQALLKSMTERFEVDTVDFGNPDLPFINALLTDSAFLHLAGRAHIVERDTDVSLARFRKSNVELTRQMAQIASGRGIRRFMFLSSANVESKFTQQMPFAVSKIEAEETLKKVCSETGMEYVIIRPPLVYGPGVKANFLSMLKWVSRGVPLPLGGIKGNKRSLVFVDNLVDLIKTCIEHPAAANQTFLVSDDDDVSTRDLLVRVAMALGVKSRLLNIPPSWLGLAGKLLGKKDIEQRLSASLQVDIAHTKNTLNWTPPYSMEEGLKQTADWYKARS